MKTISFIIAVRPGTYPSKAVEHILAIEYPLELIEILIAEGTRPSLQRNEAAFKASGDVLYFLDDDSFIAPDCVKTGLRYVSKDRIGAIGGPALAHAEATPLELLISDIVGSPFGTLTTRSRFKAIGGARLVRGEELILCNLMVPRAIYQSMSGLNTKLYPNEENEFFKRLRNAGYGFYYIPEMVVLRTGRDTVGAFITQMFRYGMGRGHHILRKFAPADSIFFLPSLFVAYLALFLMFPNRWSAVPLCIYLLFIGTGAAAIGFRRRSARSAFLALPFFMMMHLAYGIGLFYGLFGFGQQKEPDASPIKITRIAPHLGADEELLPVEAQAVAAYR